MSVFPEFIPWYRGLKGPLTKSGENRFVSHGIIERGKKDTVIVKELPVGMWTNKFKEMCEDLVQEKQLKSMKNYSTPKEVNIVLNETDNGISCNLSNLKLHSYVYVSNMVLFDENDKLKKYASVDEIVDAFCKVRFRFYTKRKCYMLKEMNSDITRLKNKLEFVKVVVEGKLDIMNRKENDIVSVLEQMKIGKEDDSYDYLLRLQVRTFTNEKILELQKEIDSKNEKLASVHATTEGKMWKNDLAEFEKQYEKFISVMEKPSKR
jgi:DNA topoisomerase-2